MVWGRDSSGDTGRFEAKALPSAQYPDADHSAVIGIGAAAPATNPIADPAGLSRVSDSVGKSAWKRRLAPHHREAVKTFFSPDPTTRKKD